MYNRCGSYPQVLDEARMNIHQGSYVVSIRLILLFILVSSVWCVEVRFKGLLAYNSQGLGTTCHIRHKCYLDECINTVPNTIPQNTKHFYNIHLDGIRVIYGPLLFIIILLNVSKM